MLASVVAASSIILGSCGGGGASTEPGTGGSLTLTPAVGTFYAGVVYTFQINGGRGPFLISSSEAALFPVPFQVDGRSFQVMPHNPGVVDVNLQPGEIPSRTVVVSVRDSTGDQFTTGADGIRVAANFFTGYGFTMSSNCPAPATGDAPEACAGGTSLIRFAPSVNGNRFGLRTYQFDVVRGNFQFLNVETGQTANSVTLTTDHEGKVLVAVRVTAGIGGEIDVFRVTDLATGTSTLQSFPVTAITPGELTLIPDSITFTGSNDERCGEGTAQIFVFDGVPPYTAASSLTAFSAEASGNTVTVRAFGTCAEGTIVVTDTVGNRGTAEVVSELGTESVPPVAVTPTTLDMNGLNDGCGFRSAAAVTGGSSPRAISSHPRVTATVSGNVLSVTRIASGDGATIYPTEGTVTVTDGRTSVAVSLTNIEANCP